MDRKWQFDINPLAIEQTLQQKLMHFLRRCSLPQSSNPNEIILDHRCLSIQPVCNRIQGTAEVSAICRNTQKEPAITYALKIKNTV